MRPPKAFRSPQAAGVDRRDELRRLTTQFLGLRGALEGLTRGTRTRSSSGATTASTASDAGLGLSGISTAANLSSQVYGPNTHTESPDWTGGSSANITIGGSYDGAFGDDTLQFEAVSGGVVGVNAITLEVRDGAGALVDTVTADFGYAGEELAVEGGLTLSLELVSIEEGDTFAVDVESEPSVDPDLGFNKDPFGSPVGAGEFFINGEEVKVKNSDSLNDVIDTINSSAAGVTASYEAASDTLQLVQDTTGSGATITLSGDTSGFLDATGLSSATIVAGADDASAALIEDVTALSGISAGTFSVNGTALAVDPSKDTLGDVLARINDADLGVTASFDEALGGVRIQGSADSTFTLDDGDSGFFTALQIDTGSHSGTEGAKRASFRSRGAARRELGELAKTLNAFFASDFDEQTTTRLHAKTTRSRVDTALRSALAPIVGDTDHTRIATKFGITVDFSGEGDLLKIDEAELTQAVASGSSDLVEFLHGNGASRPGLLAMLDEGLESAGRSLLKSLDASDGIGLAIDLAG